MFSGSTHVPFRREHPSQQLGRLIFWAESIQLIERPCYMSCDLTSQCCGSRTVGTSCATRQILRRPQREPKVIRVAETIVPGNVIPLGSHRVGLVLPLGNVRHWRLLCETHGWHRYMLDEFWTALFCWKQHVVFASV